MSWLFWRIFGLNNLFLFLLQTALQWKSTKNDHKNWFDWAERANDSSFNRSQLSNHSSTFLSWNSCLIRISKRQCGTLVSQNVFGVSKLTPFQLKQLQVTSTLPITTPYTKGDTIYQRAEMNYINYNAFHKHRFVGLLAFKDTLSIYAKICAFKKLVFG